MLSEEDQNTKDDLDSIAKAFGFVVIQWGSAEQSLDMLVALLWQSFPVRVYAKKIPKMLDPKLTFIRASFGGVQSLHPLIDEAEKVLNEFDRLSSLRHDLIHGAVTTLAPIDGHFVLAKFDICDDFHHVREVRIPITSYPRLARDLVTLGRNAHNLANAVFQLVNP